LDRIDAHFELQEEGFSMAFNIVQFAPYLGATGNALVNLDENTSGADDFAGQLLMYAAEVIAAVSDGQDLPPFPDAIANGVTEKITGVSRAILIVASSVLMVAQFQVSGKAGLVLKYASQAISRLLAGQTVPTAPASIR
jgi:hypothetical protein